MARLAMLSTTMTCATASTAPHLCNAVSSPRPATDTLLQCKKPGSSAHTFQVGRFTPKPWGSPDRSLCMGLGSQGASWPQAVRHQRSSRTALRSTAESTDGQQEAAADGDITQGGPSKASSNSAVVDQVVAMQQALQEEPELQQRLSQLNEALANDPAAAARMNAVSGQLASPEFQAKLQVLREDPELKHIFEDIMNNGPAAMMKYWNDPEILQKISLRMGAARGAAPPPGVSAAAAAPSRPPPVAEDVTDLRGAAKANDAEAAEDFIAIGRDVNEGDAEGRTPLHYAVAFNSKEVFQILMDAKANVDAKDSKDNTPLHYAAGYGRVDLIKPLVDAGASIGVVNSIGKTAHGLATMDPRNPINGAGEILALLEVKGEAAAEGETPAKKGFFVDQEA